MSNDVKWLARSLMALYSQSTPEARSYLRAPLRALSDRMVSDALGEHIGPARGEKQYVERHIWAVKVMWFTGHGPDYDARCQGMTTAGFQCRNRPTLGVKHCHVHSNDREKETAGHKAEQWVKTYFDALSKAGSYEILMDIDLLLDEPKIKVQEAG